MADNAVAGVLDRLNVVKDTMTVSRVFGEAYQADGVTVIPVALVRGGGGGGGGEGVAPAANGTEADAAAASGSGSGVGLGVNARPIGVYVIKDGEVTWQPAVDVMRIVLGGQIVALFAILTLRRLFSRR